MRSYLSILPLVTIWVVYLTLLVGKTSLHAEDVSPPAILQWFEASYETMEKRAPDVFMAGYGAIWIPPVGRAGKRGKGDNSVGYDPFDRFDLGTSDRRTRYGTEEGLKRAITVLHRASVDTYIDFVINHNGHNDEDSKDGAISFAEAGDYPGFVLSVPGDDNGDFHDKRASGEIEGRPHGHGIDIDHDKQHRFVRNPVPGQSKNIPAGTKIAFERIADEPKEENRRFYPDRDLPPILLFNPRTGQHGLKVFPFNLDDPAQGDPTEETAMGYLMRNSQWLVQVIGVDGFRIDAAKHVTHDALLNFDQAVYRSNPRKLLNGSTKHVFCFGETKDRKIDKLKPFVVKTIDPSDPGKIGSNRDTLDFSFFDNVKENLTGNGFINDWQKIKNCSLDFHDDGLHNGSSGVKFLASHDDGGPHLSNVAYACMLMLPGNAIVYHRASEFGNVDFPKDGRADALGGIHGNRITQLLRIRNSHGRGDFRECLVEKELYSFERRGSAVVLLSNRLDQGFDSRSLAVSFEPGTKLVELTGNASDPGIDPRDDIPEVVEVRSDRKINVRFPRNAAAAVGTHNSGYLIYGLATPQSEKGLELVGVDNVENGETPAASTNGTALLTDVHVITGTSFQIKLKLRPVNLLGSIRDEQADGDNALFSIDGGIDANGNGQVDFRKPGTPSYGFERFLDKSDPLIRSDGSTGTGEFVQTVDATKLEPGTHFIEARAFRHRPGGGPAVYSSFKAVVRIKR